MCSGKLHHCPSRQYCAFSSLPTPGDVLRGVHCNDCATGSCPSTCTLPGDKTILAYWPGIQSWSTAQNKSKTKGRAIQGRLQISEFLLTSVEVVGPRSDMLPVRVALTTGAGTGTMKEARPESGDSRDRDWIDY